MEVREPATDSLASSGPIRTTTNTVQRAFSQLEADGFVRVVPNRGTFVADDPPHLHNYALLFYSQHPTGPTWQNGMWATLERMARAISATTNRNIRMLSGIAPGTSCPDYTELLRDIECHRLAGLIFCFDPEFLTGTPVLDAPGFPRVCLHDSLCPGVPTIRLDGRQFWERAVAHLASQGCRRLSFLCHSAVYEELTSSVPEMARQHNLVLDEAWMQSVDVAYPEWAEHLVQLLFRGPMDGRPDGLIVADDNLFEHACRGLVKAGVRLERDAHVVAHANFPLNGQDLLPVCRLGFDIQQLLLTSVDMIDRLRRGEAVPKSQWIPAVFDSEASSTKTPAPQRRVAQPGEPPHVLPR